MSATTHFNLIEPAKTDGFKVSDFNSNMTTIDTEMYKPPLTVNGESPESTTRNITIEKVSLAENLASDIAQVSNGEFIIRTSGGDSSIEDGEASLLSVSGNIVRTGYVAESINMSVTPAAREAGVAAITATLNRATFIAYVSSSSTITLTYTTAWSADPTSYGITVTGTPVNGDVITVVYVKENRGTITTAAPASFSATGWNLYNNTTQYAQVVAYSDQYGYRVGGTYTSLYFSTTLTGTRTAVTVADGLFNVSQDGYIFVNGGDATTYIYPTWSDWTDEYAGEFEAYTVDTIDLTEAMLNFPYGLCAVGGVRDEINLNIGKTIRRIERVSYSDLELASLIEDGTAYIYDTNYIYYVLDEEDYDIDDIDIELTYSVSDHGIEFFTGTTIPAVTENLYGENLIDKLRSDVVTISSQTLSDEQKAQVRENIGAGIGSKVLFESETAFTSGNVAVPGINAYRLCLLTMSNGGKLFAIVSSALRGYNTEMLWNGSTARTAICSYEIVDEHLYINQYYRGFNPDDTIDQSNYQESVSYGLIKVEGIF